MLKTESKYKYLLKMIPDIAVFSMLETAYYQDETKSENISGSGLFYIGENLTKPGETETINTNLCRGFFKITFNNSKPISDNFFVDSEYIEVLSEGNVKYYIVISDSGKTIELDRKEISNGENLWIMGVAF